MTVSVLVRGRQPFDFSINPPQNCCVKIYFVVGKKIHRSNYKIIVLKVINTYLAFLLSLGRKSMMGMGPHAEKPLTTMNITNLIMYFAAELTDHNIARSVMRATVYKNTPIPMKNKIMLLPP